MDSSVKVPMIKNPSRPHGRGQTSGSNYSAVVRRPYIIRKIRQLIKNSENLLIILTILSVVFGSVFGIIIKKSTNLSVDDANLISFPGDLLMSMLKMLIIPLIVSSLITGLTGLDPKSTGKMGGYTLIYYFTTTIMAVLLGIVLVLTIKPGADYSDTKTERKAQKERPGTLYSFLDLLRNIFPPNIIEATMRQTLSEFQYVTKSVKVPIGNLTFNSTLNSTDNSTERVEQQIKRVIGTTKIESTNVLGLVMFSMCFGIILSQMGEKALLMVQFFNVLNEVVMRLVKIIMWYSPIGITFLIIGKIIAIENLEDTLKKLVLYMLTVILGLLVHTVITLAGVYFMITRKNPLYFFRGLFQAWITALGTASSAATLPITFKCLEENLGIDKRVTRFVLPIGATINMDGTALYEAVASIFIAQMNDRNLDIFQVFTVSITATLAAIGAASVPSAGLVTMVLVLTSVNLPTEDITVIYAVDWLLDRIRTSINVLGDAFGAGIVHHLTRETIQRQDEEVAQAAAHLLEGGGGGGGGTEDGGDDAADNSESAGGDVRKRMSVALAMRVSGQHEDDLTRLNQANRSLKKRTMSGTSGPSTAPSPPHYTLANSPPQPQHQQLQQDSFQAQSAPNAGGPAFFPAGQVQGGGSDGGIMFADSNV